MPEGSIVGRSQFEGGKMAAQQFRKKSRRTTMQATQRGGERANLTRFEFLVPSTKSKARSDESDATRPKFRTRGQLDMRHRQRFLCRMALFSGVALTASGFVPAHAQQEARPQTNAQFQDRDDDATRRELADLDRFLDQHQQVNQELQANPRLINDQNYLNAHPQFAQFLQTHPALQRRFSADPNQFLLLENRFEGREERGERANPEATRRELAELDRFLDAHPRVGTELQAHPMLQQRFSADPNEFVRLENRFEAREERGERAQPPEAMPRELAELDRFLDSHPRVNQDLQANPGLVNDRNYLNTHPQFAQFLETHPILQQRFSANPNSFIRREGRFDAREDRTGVDRDRDARVPDDRDQPEAANRDDRDRDRNFDPDRNRDDRARNVGRPDDGLNPPVTQRELAQM